MTLHLRVCQLLGPDATERLAMPTQSASGEDGAETAETLHTGAETHRPAGRTEPAVGASLIGR
jgi:hypothetical protein